MVLARIINPDFWTLGTKRMLNQSRELQSFTQPKYTVQRANHLTHRRSSSVRKPRAKAVHPKSNQENQKLSLRFDKKRGKKKCKTEMNQERRKGKV